MEQHTKKGDAVRRTALHQRTTRALFPAVTVSRWTGPLQSVRSSIKLVRSTTFMIMQGPSDLLRSFKLQCISTEYCHQAGKIPTKTQHRRDEVGVLNRAPPHYSLAFVPFVADSRALRATAQRLGQSARQALEDVLQQIRPDHKTTTNPLIEAHQCRPALVGTIGLLLGE